jgi:sugar-specific transcriptional regulator TrmB
MSSQTIFFIILVIVNMLAMFLFYLFLKSRFSQKRILNELKSEVDSLIIDLGREADRDVAILESRIKNLRSLIDEADKRILIAGKEILQRQEESDILQRIKKPIAQPVIDKIELPTQPLQEVKSPIETVRIYTRPRIVSSDKKIEPFVPVQERVIDMARQGFSAEMISGNLSLSLGEVELIIDMNRSSL